MTMINGSKYRGIKRYKDRHGKIHHYFRATGTRLPDPAKDFGQFDQAYQVAIKAQNPDRQKLPRLQKFVFQDRAPVFSGPPPTPPTKTRSGVYLLFNNGQLTYIGESANMTQRVKDHKANGRPFDRAYFIKTEPKERFAVERALIAALRPPQNNRLYQSRAPQINATEHRFEIN